jgi:hypothetical protein
VDVKNDWKNTFALLLRLQGVKTDNFIFTFTSQETTALLHSNASVTSRGHLMV